MYVAGAHRARIYIVMHALHIAAWLSLALAFVCAAAIAIDLVRRPQSMAVMNLVWPITALYGSVLALWFYWTHGRAADATEAHAFHPQHADRQSNAIPTPTQVTMATSHCGAGCALADILVEFAIFGFGITLLGSALWASYFYDLIAAWALGIAFQYYSIKPMGKMSVGAALRRAIQADTLSIITFQVGMYAFMAVVFFGLFPAPHLRADTPEYWFMMQIAMCVGFLTAWPMNRALVRRGIKHAM